MSRTAYFEQRARGDYTLARILASLYGVTQAQIDLWEIQFNNMRQTARN